MTFTELKDYLEAAFYATTIIGIPVSIFVFLSEKRKERLAREMETYLQANEKYIQYLALCLDHPNLDCFDLAISDKLVHSTGLSIQKLTLFTILISMMEAGFLLYRRHKTAIRRTQWQGWYDYMVMWADRLDFRQAWPVIGPQFDSEFYTLMTRLISESKGQAAKEV